ncbi:hypothetical protein H0H93_005458, partial [Arthromyces matolae]
YAGLRNLPSGFTPLTKFSPSIVTQWMGQVAGSAVRASLAYNGWAALQVSPILVISTGGSFGTCYNPFYGFGFLPLAFATLVVLIWAVIALARRSLLGSKRVEKVYGGLAPYAGAVTAQNLSKDTLLIWEQSTHPWLQVVDQGYPITGHPTDTTLKFLKTHSNPNGQAATTSLISPPNNPIAVPLTARSTGTSEPDTTLVDEVMENITSTGEEKKEHEDLKPKKRIQKRTHKSTGSFKNVRGRRGALQDIVEMPLDILHETFMYLTSIEMLHLSRTCTSLRRIVMTKSAEYVWKQARINLRPTPNEDVLWPRIPRIDCPRDLNEAQLAAFLFGELCDNTSLNSLNKKLGVEDDDPLNTVLKCLLPSISGEILNLEDPHPHLERYVFCEASAVEIRNEYKRLATSAQEEWVDAHFEQRERRIKEGEKFQEWLDDQKEARERRYDA